MLAFFLEDILCTWRRVTKKVRGLYANFSFQFQRPYQNQMDMERWEKTQIGSSEMDLLKIWWFEMDPLRWIACKMESFSIPWSLTVKSRSICRSWMFDETTDMLTKCKWWWWWQWWWNGQCYIFKSLTSESLYSPKRRSFVILTHCREFPRQNIQISGDPKTSQFIHTWNEHSSQKPKNTRVWMKLRGGDWYKVLVLHSFTGWGMK